MVCVYTFPYFTFIEFLETIFNIVSIIFIIYTILLTIIFLIALCAIKKITVFNMSSIIFANYAIHMKGWIMTITMMSILKWFESCRKLKKEFLKTNCLAVLLLEQNRFSCNIDDRVDF